VKYVVRQGKRRGRGCYLTWSPVGVCPPYFYHYTRYQRRARHYSTAKEALAAAANVWHVTSYRVVKLKEKA
jgi:hypothetical protein